MVFEITGCAPLVRDGGSCSCLMNPALSLAEIDGAGRVVSEAHIAQTTLNHRGLGWRLEFGGSHKQNLTCNLDKGHARTGSRQSTVRHSANGPTKRDLLPKRKSLVTLRRSVAWPCGFWFGLKNLNGNSEAAGFSSTRVAYFNVHFVRASAILGRIIYASLAIHCDLH